jgi:hypothetical protein
MVDADYVAETQEDTTTTGEKNDVTKPFLILQMKNKSARHSLIHHLS